MGPVVNTGLLISGFLTVEGKMKRDQRFPVVLSESERQILDRLANEENLSASAIIRRLIIREAKVRGLLSPIQPQIREGEG